MREMTQALAKMIPDSQVLVDRTLNGDYKVHIAVTLPMDSCKNPESLAEETIRTLVPHGYIQSAEKYKKLVSVMKMLGEEM